MMRISLWDGVMQVIRSQIDDAPSTPVNHSLVIDRSETGAASRLRVLNR
jgi:hypothetical protein